MTGFDGILRGTSGMPAADVTHHMPADLVGRLRMPVDKEIITWP